MTKTNLNSKLFRSSRGRFYECVNYLLKKCYWKVSFSWKILCSILKKIIFVKRNSRNAVATCWIIVLSNSIIFSMITKFLCFEKKILWLHGQAIPCQMAKEVSAHLSFFRPYRITTNTLWKKLFRRNTICPSY